MIALPNDCRADSSAARLARVFLLAGLTFLWVVPSVAITGASADLSIANVSETFATPGLPTHFVITAQNETAGEPVDSATVTVTFSGPCSRVTWTCTGANGGTCAAQGEGAVNDASVGLPPGGSVSYRATCDLPSSIPYGSMVSTATVTAAGVFDPVLGNNTAMSYTTITPIADLAITVTDGVRNARPGGFVTYRIVASNRGASDAPRSVVENPFSPACRSVAWTCLGAAGGTCNSTGFGAIEQRADLPAGGSVTYTAACNISSTATGMLTNTAKVRTGQDVLVVDYSPDNNTATDIDFVEVQGATIDIPALNGIGVCALALAMALFAVGSLRKGGFARPRPGEIGSRAGRGGSPVFPPSAR